MESTRGGVRAKEILHDGEVNDMTCAFDMGLHVNFFTCKTHSILHVK